MENKKYVIEKIRSNGKSTFFITLPLEFSKEINYKIGNYVKVSIVDKNTLKIENTGL